MEATKNWSKYIAEEAMERDIPFPIAWDIFWSLGENEAYDGFVTAMEDYAHMLEMSDDEAWMMEGGE